MTPELAHYLRHERHTVAAPMSPEYMPTERAPMCHLEYMDTLFDEPLDMPTGGTQPMPLEAALPRRPARGPANTDQMPLDLLVRRLEPGSIITPVPPTVRAEPAARPPRATRRAAPAPLPNERLAKRQEPWSRLAAMGCLLGLALLAAHLIAKK